MLQKLKYFDIETLRIAIINLSEQKIRSLLTVTGIIISIVIIVSLLLIGQSMQKSIEKYFESLGVNVLILRPGSAENMISSAFSKSLKDEDIRIIRSIRGVEDVVPFYGGSGILRKGNQEVGVIILGIKPEHQWVLEKVGYLIIKEGRKLLDNDKYSVVIYEDFADRGLKDDVIGIKEKILLNNITMKVVGISKQNAFLGMSFPNIVIVSDSAAKELFDINNVTEAMVVVSKENVNETKKEIEITLEKAHGEKDFYIMSSEDMLNNYGVIISLVQIIVLGIASISLIVGAVGISNTMLMSVIERTREIGVMKATGATNNRIISLFLAESAMIGAVGGLIGIAIGLSLMYLISYLAFIYNIFLPFIIDLKLLGAIFLFSITLGIVAGYAPAKKAASLDPVEALHYE